MEIKMRTETEIINKMNEGIEFYNHGILAIGVAAPLDPPTCTIICTHTHINIYCAQLND